MIFSPPVIVKTLRRVLLIGLFLVSGCGSQQSVKPIQPAPSPSASADAKLRNGDFIGAAEAYSSLSQSAAPEDRSRYQALAVFTYLDGGDQQTAADLMSTTPADDRRENSLNSLALAALDRLESGTGSAAAHLENVEPRKLTPYQRNIYYRTVARVAMFDQAFPAAVNAFVAADAYVLPSTNRAALHLDTWRALSHMSSKAIATARASALGRASGWLQLAAAAQPNLHNSAALASAVEMWRAAHSDHPANISLVEQLFEISETLSARPRHIALLLPFNGRYANAANSIRDGFLTAWYGSSVSGSRPIISLYSVDAERVSSIYDAAIENGADLIVGPLEKTAVNSLTANTELSVRTLTLNIAEQFKDSTVSNNSASSAQLFQFGLSPEDEAEEAANRIRADGHLRALVIGPDTPWGERLTERFNQRWQQLGGILLDQVRYPAENNAYSQTVKQALNIDSSEARAAQLRRTLKRSIQFEPRRRADVEAIFVAGFPLSARQLLPQLRYFRTESVPVYSTSHAFSGAPNSAADQDLDGLIFCDMPWLFGAADKSSNDLYAHHWSDRAPGARRLFAFGLDAYRILPYLARMRHQPDLRIPGATGLLKMDSNGRVIRQLTWARFTTGLPKLIDL